MATFKTFEQIDAWQKSRELTKQITGQGTFVRDYGLKDQIRRASVSVMSNIAEDLNEAVLESLRSSWRPRKVRPAR